MFIIHYNDATMSAMVSQITGISNGYLLNCLFRRTSNKTSKLRVSGFREGNPPWPVDSPLPRLGNSVTGFMISDESGNRFFPTAVTDYWQDKAVCRHEHQRKRQISGLSSMSMVVIVRYFSSGPLLSYTMPWGLQTLKNMMNHTRCEGSYTNDE